MVIAQAEKYRWINKQVRKQGHFTYTAVSTDVVLGDKTCAQEQRAVLTQRLVKKKKKRKEKLIKKKKHKV